MTFDPDWQADVLNLATRRTIFEAVRRHAGCHLREIQRVTHLPFGSVSYHLSYLVRHNLLKEKKDGRNIRYFPIDVVTEDEKLLMLLRQESVRTILLFVFAHEGCAHKEIAAAVKLSPSTTTWHLNKLLDADVIGTRRTGKYKSYKLVIPRERVMALLLMYQESFLDQLVDNLIDLWER